MSNAEWLRLRMDERDLTIGEVALLCDLTAMIVGRALGGHSTLMTDLKLSIGFNRQEEKTAWARRLLAVADKHERVGGPDEQQLADWGRTS